MRLAFWFGSVAALAGIACFVSVAAPIAVDDLSRLRKWIDLHSQVKGLRLELRSVGQPEVQIVNGPPFRRIDLKYCVRWPDGMALEQSTFWPAQHSIDATSTREADWQKGQLFQRVFRPDATVQSRVWGEEIDEFFTAQEPKLFVEAGWQYSEMTPWITALLLGLEDSSHLDYMSDDSLVIVSVKRVRQRILFWRDKQEGLRLHKIEKMNSGEVDEAYEFSDYVRIEGLPFFVPKTRTDFGKQEMLDTKSGRVTFSSGLKTMGSTTLVRAEAEADFREGDFAIAASPSQPHDSRAKELLNPLPSSQPIVRESSKPAWIIGICGAAAIGFAIAVKTRRR